MKRLIKVKLSMLVGIAAASASDEYQDRNILSTNCCTENDPVLKINGKAIYRICLYPFCWDHLLRIVLGTGMFKEINLPG